MQVELSGVSNIGTLSDPTINYVVTLTADNFLAAGVSVIQNAGNSYAFNLSSGDYNGYSFTGTSAADTITNYGASIAINGLGGDDVIDNNGDFAIIDGGGGDDSITNSGSNVSISGGSGKNVVNLNGGNNATVNTSLGDDTINVGTNITNFEVAGFSAGDVIQLSTSVSAITVDGDTLTAGNVNITGISSIYSVSDDWNVVSASSILYHIDTVAGAVLGSDSTTITYDATHGSSTLFTIDGLSLIKL